MATVGVSMLPRLAAQSPPASLGPAFEVASIKPNPTGFAGPARSQIQPGGRFVATNIPVRLLIGQAYQVQSYRLLGGPSWLLTEGFDIEARATGELFPRGGLRPLEGALRALLADRFKLVVHTETRQLPIYALVVARRDGRLGPNLTRSSTTDCEAVLAARGLGRGAPPPPTPGQAPPCDGMTGNGTFSVDSARPSQLANYLSAYLEKRVVDQTGLTGLFNAHLTWTPDQTPQRPDSDLPPIDPNGLSIFTAVQEQLGLKLESQKGPVDVLVIDSVEKPSPD
ncbi:MAG TPA: TIGR03435 family protein [Vicinamibacterales bacterium]